MEKGATFSPDRKYRYTLWRYWGSPTTKLAMFIGLNPSTADEENDDPTIRREIGYAKQWGYGGLCKVNLFGFRATSPKDMMAAEDPIGPENDRCLDEIAKCSAVVVAAWGIHGAYLNRDQEVADIIPTLHYLRFTKGGFPGHPLYLPKNLKPILWKGKA